MKHPIWLILLILAAELLIIVMFIPNNWHNEIGKAQWQSDYLFYGEEAMVVANRLASQYYTELILESQLKFELIHFLIPTELEKLNSRGMSNLGNVWFEWLQSRLEAGFSAVENLFHRIVLLTYWWALLGLILVSVLLDGYLKLKIRQSDFSYSSPTVHRYAFKTACCLFFISLLCLILPIVIAPWFIPLLNIVACMLIGSVIANRQKQI